jgi:hypothetical protein
MRILRLAFALTLTILSVAPISAADRFALEATVTPAERPGAFACAVRVLDQATCDLILEKSLVVLPGSSSTARSGSQDGKGGEISRKLECALSEDSRTALVRFTNTETRNSDPPRVEVIEVRVYTK